MQGAAARGVRAAAGRRCDASRDDDDDDECERRPAAGGEEGSPGASRANQGQPGPRNALFELLSESRGARVRCAGATYSDDNFNLRIVIYGFGTARQKMALERWTDPKPLGMIVDRAAIELSAEGFWICPSFKGHFLSRRARP
jgi:hypothetical protein